MIASAVSTICHGTHLDEIKEICIVPNFARFTGKEKQWRPGKVYSKGEQTVGSEYCSYIIEELDKESKPITKQEQWPFGPFLWFGTKNGDAKIYGSYCFDFQLKSVLRQYQQSRGSSCSICYRAGGTLLYREEVTHVVIVCCEDDQDYESYPLIDATNTKYFKPPKIENIKSINTPSKKQKLNPWCEDASTQSLEYFVPAKVSINAGLKQRHEHVALAFYLPHDIGLHLTNEDGKLSIMQDHNRYCAKSSGKYKVCQYSKIEESYIHDFNDPFDYNTLPFDHLEL